MKHRLAHINGNNIYPLEHPAAMGEASGGGEEITSKAMLIFTEALKEEVLEAFPEMKATPLVAGCHAELLAGLIIGNDPPELLLKRLGKFKGRLISYTVTDIKNSREISVDHEGKVTIKDGVNLLANVASIHSKTL